MKQAFADAYLRNGGNATAAARAAGYAHPNVKGPELVAKDSRGELIDRSLARYFAECATDSRAKDKAAASKVLEFPTPGGAQVTRDELARMFTVKLRDPTTPDHVFEKLARTYIERFLDTEDTTQLTDEEKRERLDRLLRR